MVNVDDSCSEPCSSDVGSNPELTLTLDGPLDGRKNGNKQRQTKSSSYTILNVQFYFITVHQPRMGNYISTTVYILNTFRGLISRIRKIKRKM